MSTDSTIGELSVLSVGHGDMKFNFNSDDPLETARAHRVIDDMLRRGYLLFVEVKGKLRRAKSFDPKTNCYVIADGPEVAPSPSDPEKVDEPAAPKRKRGRPIGTTQIPAKSAKATGIAPTAGG